MKNKWIWLLPFGLFLLCGYAFSSSVTDKHETQIVKQQSAQLNKQDVRVTEGDEPQEMTGQDSFLKIKKVMKQFVSIYFDYDNQEDYDNRAKKASSYVDFSESKQKEIFNSGRDRTNGSIIENLGLHSELKNQVTYFVQETDKQMEVMTFVTIQAQQDGREKATGYVFVHAWVNKATNKITDVQLKTVY
ncbi:hypothetical protein [Fructobacillus cardui]|uniref:hypothetical protein n=1 Tax=Fructobacillus cardui TaxID=2893170 RepID=UPI002D838F50|nr:hypothetical protein R53653_IHELHDKM_00706 [Fructobacillus cardui]